MATVVPRPPRPRLIDPRELRALRKSTGLTAAEAAKAIGIGQTVMYMYERGESVAPKYVITILQMLAAKRQALITGHRQAILDAIDAPMDISL